MVISTEDWTASLYAETVASKYHLLSANQRRKAVGSLVCVASLEHLFGYHKTYDSGLGEPLFWSNKALLTFVWNYFPSYISAQDASLQKTKCCSSCSAPHDYPMAKTTQQIRAIEMWTLGNVRNMVRISRVSWEHIVVFRVCTHSNLQ